MQGGTEISFTLVIGFFFFPGLNHRTKPESSTQHFSVCNFVMHDLFNRETLENDIAIVKIKKNAMLDDFVWPACLSSKGVSTHFTDKYGYMIGEMVAFLTSDT